MTFQLALVLDDSSITGANQDALPPVERKPSQTDSQLIVRSLKASGDWVSADDLSAATGIDKRVVISRLSDLFKQGGLDKKRLGKNSGEVAVLYRFTSQEKRIQDALSQPEDRNGWMTIDQIQARTGLSRETVQRRISGMCAAGKVESFKNIAISECTQYRLCTKEYADLWKLRQMESEAAPPMSRNISPKITLLKKLKGRQGQRDQDLIDSIIMDYRRTRAFILEYGEAALVSSNGESDDT